MSYLGAGGAGAAGAGAGAGTNTTYSHEATAGAGTTSKVAESFLRGRTPTRKPNPIERAHSGEIASPISAVKRSSSAGPSPAKPTKSYKEKALEIAGEAVKRGNLDLLKALFGIEFPPKTEAETRKAHIQEKFKELVKEYKEHQGSIEHDLPFDIEEIKPSDLEYLFGTLNKEMINDVIDEKGNRLLHYAAKNIGPNAVKTIKFLRNLGARADLENKLKETPLQVALNYEALNYAYLLSIPGESPTGATDKKEIKELTSIINILKALNSIIAKVKVNLESYKPAIEERIEKGLQKKKSPLLEKVLDETTRKVVLEKVTALSGDQLSEVIECTDKPTHVRQRIKFINDAQSQITNLAALIAPALKMATYEGLFTIELIQEILKSFQEDLIDFVKHTKVDTGYLGRSTLVQPILNILTVETHPVTIDAVATPPTVIPTKKASELLHTLGSLVAIIDPKKAIGRELVRKTPGVLTYERLELKQQVTEKALETATKLQAELLRQQEIHVAKMKDAAAAITKLNNELDEAYTEIDTLKEELAQAKIKNAEAEATIAALKAKTVVTFLTTEASAASKSAEATR